MSLEKSHSSPLVLSTVEAFDPIPVLSVRHRLLDDTINLAVIFSVDQAQQGRLINQAFRLMANGSSLANDMMKGHSVCSQHVLEEVD
jgi:hypothetical protein